MELLQKAKIPNSTESIYKHINGRVFNGDSSYYNFNPNNIKDPEVLKTFPKQLLDSILGNPPSPNDRSPQANDFRKTQRSLRENSIFLDDLFVTNKHQIFIPSPNEGGPPADWPQRRAYVIGVLTESIKLALNESKSLGSALQKVLDLDFSGKPISKSLSPQEKWQQNYFYFVTKGMIFLKSSKNSFK